MGIKNLKKIIQKHAPGAITNTPSLYNSTIAIDSSILLYKFRYTYNENNFHIQGFLYKVIEFLEKGIKPVFVFDGKPPEAKKNVLDKRMETRTKMKERVTELTELRKNYKENAYEFINSDNEEEPEDLKEIKKLDAQIRSIEKNILVVKKFHSDEVMEFLESLGIPFLQAVSESEETCAFLQKKGFVDYVLSEDTDSLTFGAKKVLFGEKVYCLETILSELDISFDSFIDLCILCGCDYTTTIPKVGPVNALKLIKKYGTIDNFENIPPEFEYQMARDLFKQNEEYTIHNSFERGVPNFSKAEYLFEKYTLNKFFLDKLKILLKSS